MWQLANRHLSGTFYGVAPCFLTSLIFRLYDEHPFICYSSLFSQLKEWPKQVVNEPRKMV